MTHGVYANWEWFCEKCNSSSTDERDIQFNNRQEAMESWKDHNATAHSERSLRALKRRVLAGGQA